MFSKVTFQIIRVTLGLPFYVYILVRILGMILHEKLSLTLLMLGEMIYFCILCCFCGSGWIMYQSKHVGW
jgi:hypothetical protein